MLKALGLVALVVLILVGALMPLKYTARMNLPKRPGADDRKSAQDRGESEAGGPR
jgi:hypothetical protein